MLNIVIQILFKVISIIGGLLCAPIVVILKPFMDYFGFTDFIPYMLGFIDLSLTYFGFFAILLHIPLAPLVLIISLGGVIFTLTVSMRAIIMIKSVWDAFKGSSGGRKIGFDTGDNR